MKWTCPHCGHENDYNLLVCAVCGKGKESMQRREFLRNASLLAVGALLPRYATGVDAPARTAKVPDRGIPIKWTEHHFDIGPIIEEAVLRSGIRDYALIEVGAGPAVPSMVLLSHGRVTSFRLHREGHVRSTEIFSTNNTFYAPGWGKFHLPILVDDPIVDPKEERGHLVYFLTKKLKMLLAGILDQDVSLFSQLVRFDSYVHSRHPLFKLWLAGQFSSPEVWQGITLIEPQVWYVALQPRCG